MSRLHAERGRRVGRAAAECAIRDWVARPSGGAITVTGRTGGGTIRVTGVVSVEIDAITGGRVAIDRDGGRWALAEERP